VFIAAYLTLAELGKAWFFRTPARTRPPAIHFDALHRRHVRKFVARWHRAPVPTASGPIDGGSA
jgi:hypothetical protein